MDPGDLEYRVEVWARTAQADSFGDRIRLWELEATRWGAVEALAGREVYHAGAARPDVSHRVTLRPYALTHEHQLRIDGSVYNVAGVTTQWIDGEPFTVAECKEDLSGI